MSYDYDGLVSEIVASRKLAREAKAALAAIAMNTKEDSTRDKTKIELERITKDVNTTSRF